MKIIIFSIETFHHKGVSSVKLSSPRNESYNDYPGVLNYDVNNEFITDEAIFTFYKR